MDIKKGFFNNWDLKSLLIILGLAFNIGYFSAQFSAIQSSQAEIKDIIKEVRCEVSGVKKIADENKSKLAEHERRINKNESKLFP